MITVEDTTGTLPPSGVRCMQEAAYAVLQHEKIRAGIYIAAVDEAHMQEANSEHRGMDSVTDVLSFPAAERGLLPPDGFYGDILLCPARAQAQAETYGHSMDRELAFLTVHGVLHLLGYDHETPEEEARMREIQTTILERMELTI